METAGWFVHRKTHRFLNSSWGGTWTPTHLLTPDELKTHIYKLVMPQSSSKFYPSLHSYICNGQSLVTSKSVTKSHSSLYLLWRHDSKTLAYWDWFGTEKFFKFWQHIPQMLVWIRIWGIWRPCQHLKLIIVLNKLFYTIQKIAPSFTLPPLITLWYFMAVDSILQSALRFGLF